MTGFCYLGLHLILWYSVPVTFGCHDFCKELFILWGQLGVLHEKRNEHIPSPPQAFYFLSVVILALLFPFWDNRAVRGEGIIIKILDMGNQIALAIPNVKTPVIMKFLAADNRRNCKVGLFVPTDFFALVFPFPMLLFVQNTEQPVPQGKAQIRKAVIQLPVIKSGVFGKTDSKCNPVWLALSALSHIFYC